MDELAPTCSTPAKDRTTVQGGGGCEVVPDTDTHAHAGELAATVGGGGAHGVAEGLESDRLTGGSAAVPTLAAPKPKQMVAK